MQHTATRSSAQQGARWLMGLQQPDGLLRGARGLHDYYKAPFALTVTAPKLLLFCESVVSPISTVFSPTAPPSSSG